MKKTQSKIKRTPKKRSSVLDRYKSEAKEIAAAKEAMQRLNKGIEMEPERMRYVTDLRFLST